jgi:hypothetical protein
MDLFKEGRTVSMTSEVMHVSQEDGAVHDHAILIDLISIV